MLNPNNQMMIATVKLAVVVHDEWQTPRNVCAGAGGRFGRWINTTPAALQNAAIAAWNFIIDR
ncbi:MAG: hypothetical protein R2873_05690 [Caldilineaceae bacterium]